MGADLQRDSTVYPKVLRFCEPCQRATLHEIRELEVFFCLRCILAIRDRSGPENALVRRPSTTFSNEEEI
jgi:hypothetical protein